jgi:glycine/D-amino acid oxidase-like deaminating enzyme
MHKDVAKIFAEQQAIGYPSVLVEGERDCRAYMLALFGDWRAPGTTAILHEQRGGYANNVRSLRGLAAKAEAEGGADRHRVTVTGIRTSGGAVTAVETDQGVDRLRAAGDRRPAPGSATCGPCSTCRQRSR